MVLAAWRVLTEDPESPALNEHITAMNPRAALEAGELRNAEWNLAWHVDRFASWRRRCTVWVEGTTLLLVRADGKKRTPPWLGWQAVGAGLRRNALIR